MVGWRRYTTSAGFRPLPQMRRVGVGSGPSVPLCRFVGQLPRVGGGLQGCPRGVSDPGGPWRSRSRPGTAGHTVHWYAILGDSELLFDPFPGDSMEDEDLVPLLETNLSRQLHWISSADGKVAFVFTFATAMLGVLAAVAPSSLEVWSTASAALTSIAAVLETVALLFASFAAFPRTEGPAGSFIYCGGIAERTREEFRHALRDMSNGSYVADLASQCHRNAEIAIAKFIWVHRALGCLYFSVPPWAVALWMLYAR